MLSNSNAHTNTGIDTLTTFRLPSSDPLNIQVTLNGIGPSTADPSTWTGVKGEVLSFSQGPQGMTNMTSTTTNMTSTATNMTTTSTNATVPEFGSAASVVLVIAVLSIIVFAAKTRVIPRL